MKRAWRRCGNPSKCNIRPGKALAKGYKAARRVLGPWWNVLRAGFETLRVSGPGGTCFTQVLKPSKCRISTWQGRGKKGERCTGGFRVLVKSAWRRCGNRLNAIFDLAKRWQRAKAARRVLGPWWNVLRAGFETL